MTFLSVLSLMSVLSVKIANVVKTVKGGQNGKFWSKLRNFETAINLFSRHERQLNTVELLLGSCCEEDDSKRVWKCKVNAKKDIAKNRGPRNRKNKFTT